MDKQKLQVPEELCALCSTEDKPVPLKYFRSCYLCPNPDCHYDPTLWNIAKEANDIALLSRILSRNVNIFANGERQQGEKDTALTDYVRSISSSPIEKLSPRKQTVLPHLDKNCVPSTTSSTIPKSSPRKQFSPKKRGKVESKNEAAEEALEENSDASPNDTANDISFSDDIAGDLVLSSDSEKEKQDYDDKVSDGICTIYENFVIWPNRDALCWLNSTLALLLHSSSIRTFVESSHPGYCEITKIYNDYKRILDEVNEKTPTPLVLVKMKKQLHAMQEHTFKFLQKKMRCVKGQPDSPVFTIPLLLKEHDLVKNMFEIKHWWSLDCEKCCATCVFEGIKTVVSFHKITEDFSLTSPVSLGICKRCLTQDQKRKLNFQKLPKTLIYHFENGYTKSDLLNADFEFQGQKYAVKGFILYTQVLEQKHFVTWVRDVRNNTWMNCDDLQPGVHQFTDIVPEIKPSEVHIVMWECISTVAVDVNNSASDKVVLALEEQPKVCTDLKENIRDTSTKFTPPLTRTKATAQNSCKFHEASKSRDIKSAKVKPAEVQIGILEDVSTVAVDDVNDSALHIPAVKESQKVCTNLEKYANDSDTPSKFTPPLTRNKATAQNSRKGFPEASKSSDIKPAKMKTAKLAESAKKKKLGVPTEEVSKDCIHSSSSTTHGISQLQHVSEHAESKAPNEVSVNSSERPPAGDVENVKEEDKKERPIYPDIKLPSFESSFRSFSSLKKSGNSKMTDGTCKGIAAMEKFQKTNKLEVLLENIFAKTSSKPSFHPTAINAKQKENVNEEKKQEESISETAVESQVSDQIPCIEFTEPDGTKIVKFSDSRLSSDEGMQKDGSADLVTGQSERASSSDNSAMPLTGTATLLNPTVGRKTRSLTSVAKQSQSKTINVKRLKTKQQKKQQHSEKKTRYQTRTKTQTAQTKAFEGISDENKLNINVPLICSEDSNQSEDTSVATKQSSASSLQNNVGQKSVSVSSLEVNIETQSTSKRKLAQETGTEEKSDSNIAGKKSNAKQSENKRSKLHKSNKSQVNKQSFETSSDPMGIETECSPGASEPERTQALSKSKAHEVMEVEETNELRPDDNSSNQFYKYMSEKIIKNVSAEKEALGSTVERKNQMLSKLVPNSVKQVESTPKVNAKKELSAINAKRKVNKNAVKTSDERSSASYNLRGKPKISSMGNVKRMSLEDSRDGTDDSNNEWLRLTSEEEETGEGEESDVDELKVSAHRAKTRTKLGPSKSPVIQTSKASSKAAKVKLTGKRSKHKIQSSLDDQIDSETSKEATSKKKARKAPPRKTLVIQKVADEASRLGTGNVDEKAAAGKKSAVNTADATGKKAGESPGGLQKTPAKVNPASKGNIPIAPSNLPSFFVLPTTSAVSSNSTSAGNTLPVFTSIASSSALKGVSSSGGPIFLLQAIPPPSTNSTSSGVVSVTSSPLKQQQSTTSQAQSPNPVKNIILVPSNFKGNPGGQFVFAVRQPSPGQPIIIPASPQMGNIAVDKIRISSIQQNTPGTVRGATPMVATNLRPQIIQRSPGTTVLRMISSNPNLPVARFPVVKEISVSPVPPTSSSLTVTANPSDSGGSKASETDSKNTNSPDKNIKTNTVPEAQASPKMNKDFKESLLRLGSGVTLTPIHQSSPVISDNSSKPETVADIKNFISSMKVKSKNTSKASNVSVKNEPIPSDAVSADETSCLDKAGPSSSKNSLSNQKQTTKSPRKAPPLKLPFMQSKGVTASKPVQALNVSQTKLTTYSRPLRNPNSLLKSNISDGKERTNPVEKSPHKVEDGSKTVSDVQLDYSDFELTRSETLSLLE